MEAMRDAYLKAKLEKTHFKSSGGWRGGGKRWKNLIGSRWRLCLIIDENRPSVNRLKVHTYFQIKSIPIIKQDFCPEDFYFWHRLT